MKKNSSREQSKVNQEIQSEKLRVIDEGGNQLGILNRQEALVLAESKNLDLVEVNSSSNPPIGRIMNWGKFLYNKKKLERKGRQKSHFNEIKGVRLGMKTGLHDLKVKQGKVQKFLGKDYKVAVEIRLKGREKIFFDKARTVLEKFISELNLEIDYDQPAKRTPHGFIAVIKNKK